MKQYPKISPNSRDIDVCSEIAPVVFYTVDQSEKTVNPNHDELVNLDKPDQHPIEAIIGLREELDNLNKKEVLLEETDPTVPDWAKNPEKPNYTAEEVGALPKNAKLADLEQDDAHLTVTLAEKKQWNSGTGIGGGFSGDYNDLLNKPYIPSSLSELADDEAHRVVTDEQIELWNKGGENVFGGSYNDLNDKPFIPSKLSELEQDDEHLTVTTTEKEQWGQSNESFSGDYNDLTNKPFIPTALAELEQDDAHQTVSTVEKIEWNDKISVQQKIEDAGKILTINTDGKIILSSLSDIYTNLTWGMLAGKS